MAVECKIIAEHERRHTRAVLLLTLFEHDVQHYVRISGVSIMLVIVLRLLYRAVSKRSLKGQHFRAFASQSFCRNAYRLPFLFL